MRISINTNRFILVLLAFVLMLSSVERMQAQAWEVGGWTGATYSFGDINTQYNDITGNIGLGVVTRLNLNNRLAIKVSGNYGMISGSDALSSDPFQRERNLSFRSRVFDGTAQFEFNFLEYEHGSKDHKFTPYVFGGVSMFYFNPQGQYRGQWYDLQPLGTEGQFRGNEYNLIQPAMAYGGGFKFDLNYSWSINLEVSARRLFTDYLDDVSGLYPDMDDLREARGNVAVALSDPSVNGIVGELGRQRGNSQNNDSYVFAGISLVYNFAAVQCFKFY